MNETEEHVDDAITDWREENESDTDDIEDHEPAEPDTESDADSEKGVRVLSQFEDPCLQCGLAIQRGQLIAWVHGPEKYGAHHLDCQSVNQHLPLGGLKSTPDIQEPDQVAILEVKDEVINAKLDEGLKTPWQSSVLFVKEAKQGIEWLIPGLLPAGAVVLLSGREGSMKTWLALNIAHAVAAGVPWIGTPTKQGAVLYLDGEMPRTVLQDRVQGIGTVKDLNIWCWTDSSFPQGLRGESLREASRRHTLIVIDTLRRHMGGLKENSADDMAIMTEALRELTRHGATVLVLHHATKDPTGPGGYRGSTELGAGADILLSLTKKSTSSAARLTLTIEKSRYSFSDKYEIPVTKGGRAPVFTVEGAPQDNATRDFEELRALIAELHQAPRPAPSQSEIIAVAGRRGLGGKDKIRRRLEDGEGTYWRSERTGNRRTYTAIVA